MTVETSAQPASVAKPKLREIRSHTALRGVAALLVIAYHLQLGGPPRFAFETATDFFRRGYVFVDLFFVLSGFIISYVNDADRPRPPSREEVRRFAIGRVARLYPLHLFCLAYFLLWRIAASYLWYRAGHDSSVLWTGRAFFILGVQLILLNAFIPDTVGWNIPTWSISAEMGAYLAFPALVALQARWREAVLAGLLLLPCAYYAAVIAIGDGNLDITAGYGWLRALAGFMLGMLLFHARGWIDRLPTPVLSVAQGLSLVWIVAVLVLPIADPWIVPAFVALVGATWPDRGIVPAMLGGRLARWLGEHSFSIYLNHVLLIEILAIGSSPLHLERRLPWEVHRAIWIVAVFAATFVAAAITYRWVERPARQWLARRWLGHPIRPIETSPAAP